MSNKKQNDVCLLAAERLEEAAELIEDWGSYASPYFKEKHDLQGDIKRILSYAKSIKNKMTERT